MSKHRWKILDYIAPSIALIASIVAVIGSPKWNDKALGLHKLTALGWATLVVGVSAFIATCIVTAKNNRERLQEKKTRERIASKGKAHILSALHHIAVPLMSDYIFGWGDLKPKSAKDMLTAERHLKLGSLDLNSVSPYAAGDFKEIRWYRMLEDSARDGSAEMITALQIFVTYLPADVIDTATKILECEFVKMHLFHLHDLVDANTHIDPNRVVPMFMFFSKEMSMDERGYREFWNLCIQLENQCMESMATDDHPQTPDLDEKFRKWAEFLNITVGILSFTLGMACVTTKTPSFNGLLCFAFVMLVRAIGQDIFPEEIQHLRKKAKADEEAKKQLKTLMKKYLSYKVILTKYPVTLAGMLFLIFIMMSHRLATVFPFAAPYFNSYFGS